MATVHHWSPTIYERGQAVFPLAKRLVLRVCMAGLVRLQGLYLGDHIIYKLNWCSGQSRAGGITICGGRHHHGVIGCCYHNIKSIVYAIPVHKLKARFRSSDMHWYLIAAV